MTDNVGKIDENLYSRMMGAYGVEAVGKLVKLRIFISGLRGVQFFNIIIKKKKIIFKIKIGRN